MNVPHFFELKKNMVWNNKKKGTRSGEVDEQTMLKAIGEVSENKLPLRNTAAKYRVNA